MQTFSKPFLQTLAGIVVLAVVGATLLLYIFGSVTVRGPGPLSQNLYRGNELALVCQLYASDNGGRLPVHLSELVPDYLFQERFDKLRYSVGDEAGKPTYIVDWLYFGAGFDKDNPPRILLASPYIGVRDGKPHRVFVEDVHHGGVAKEAYYQELLAETIQQMKALDEVRRAKVPSETPPKLPEN